eukprot:1188692-Prorocentrum_minimum.AAC.2
MLHNHLYGGAAASMVMSCRPMGGKQVAYGSIPAAASVLGVGRSRRAEARVPFGGEVADQSGRRPIGTLTNQDADPFW